MKKMALLLHLILFVFMVEVPTAFAVNHGVDDAKVSFGKFGSVEFGVWLANPDENLKLEVSGNKLLLINSHTGGFSEFGKPDAMFYLHPEPVGAIIGGHLVKVLGVIQVDGDFEPITLIQRSAVNNGCKE